MKRNITFVLVLVFMLTCVLNCFNFSVAYADTERTKQIQQRLTDYGYYNGEINGFFDDATVGAIKRFQANNGLNVTGAVDSATASALGIYMSSQESYDLYYLLNAFMLRREVKVILGK